jgi:hypothetical protein
MSSQGIDGVVVADNWSLEQADLVALVGKQGVTALGLPSC